MINELKAKQELPAGAKNHVITTPRTFCIYFYPKFTNLITQVSPLSQLAVALRNLFRYLDKIMVPIIKSLPSYIKESQHALQIFRDFNFLGQDKLIFTMDITKSSLYTVIPNGRGLLALKHFFD